MSETSNTITTTGTSTSASITGVSNYSHTVLDKWYVDEKSVEKLKEDLFSFVIGHEYKVKIEHSDIMINGMNKSGYHLIILREGWSYDYGWNSITTPVKQYEITC